MMCYLTDTICWLLAGLIIEKIIFLLFNTKQCWREHLTANPCAPRMLANKTLSMVHAIGCIGIAMHSLIKLPHWTVANAAEHVFLIRFNLSYFACDSLYMLLYDQSALFLMHHAAGIGLDLMTLYTGVGGFYLTLAIFLGEMSNPLQTTWTVAREQKLTRLYHIITPYFTFIFLALRVFIMPIAASMVLWDVWHHHACFAMWHKICLSFLVVALSIGGWIWSWSLYKGYRKYAAKKFVQ